MALAQQVQLQPDPGARSDLARRVTGSPALQRHTELLGEQVVSRLA